MEGGPVPENSGDMRSLQAECQDTKQCQLLDPNLAKTFFFASCRVVTSFHKFKTSKRYLFDEFRMNS